MNECVRSLARLAGVSMSTGRSYDWETIEGSLGIGLPSDYKLISDTFPDGWFRMFAAVRHPHSRVKFSDEYMDDIANVFQDLRRNGYFADVDFPFSMFPSTGGLLLAGSLRSPGYLFWRTSSGNPDEWPLVLADEGYAHWESYAGSLCDFLTDVALGQFDASRFKDDYGWNDEEFININSRPVFGTD